MIEQGSPEWYDIRCGKVTASRISDIMARQRSGGVSGLRRTYAGQLAAERLSGRVDVGFKSHAMQRGNEVEAEARAAYLFYTDQDVKEVGFVDHPEIPMAGCSPDGLVGDSGLVEIKCPNTANHIDMAFTRKIEKQYLHQMDWQMACTGRQWCDFVSYDPRLPEHMAIWVHRVERDDLTIEQLEGEVRRFQHEIEAKVNRMKELFPS